jgi:hypothetical protein
MLLASVADVRSQLGFDDMTDINAAITMAMDAAEAQLAAILNTEFDRGSFVDTYFVREPPFRDGPAVETEFRLQRGMVQSLTQVVYAYQISDLSNSAAYTDTTSVSVLSGDKGVVTDYQTHFMRQYVQISYTAGFDVDPSNTASYLLSEVPDWLQNAAKLRTLLSLADSPVLSEAQIKLDTRMLQTQFNALVSRHMRYAPRSIMPL